MSRVFAIVAAAGGGTRFGAHLAKQYVAIGDKPMLVHSIERLQRAVAPARTLVALGVEDHEYEARISRLPDVDAVRCGGVTRAATVRNALDRLAPQSEADDWILVHDAARPCGPRETLSRLVRELADDPVGGLLAIPVTDTLKRADDDPAARRVIATQDRHALWQAQTPQMFRFRILADALAAPGSLDTTDEAQAVETLAAGGRCGRPRLVMGSAENIKVTYAQDLALATAILALQAERDHAA